MNNKGFLIVSREMFSNEYWEENRAFSKWEAYMDLLQSARYADDEKIIFIKGKRMKIGKNQLIASERFLIARWRWKSRTKVKTFLETLESMKKIKIESTPAGSRLTVYPSVGYKKVETTDKPQVKKNKTTQTPKGFPESDHLNSSLSINYNKPEASKKPEKDQQETSKKPVNNLNSNKEIKESKEIPIHHAELHSPKSVENNFEVNTQKKQKVSFAPQQFKYKKDIVDIVDYLNQKAVRKFSPSTRATIQLITQRLNEGYKVADFYDVILTKVNEWKGKDMERHLCPDTLFEQSKFEKYLQQSKIKSNESINQRNLYVRGAKPNSRLSLKNYNYDR